MGLRADPVRWTLLPVLGVAAIAAWLLHRDSGWAPWVAWAVAVNAVTPLVWIVDKWRARRGGFRVPEWTLHLLALAGATPASLASMRLLRHKSRQRRFYVLYVAALAAQVAAVVWLRRG